MRSKVLAAALFALGSALLAHADTVYTYTGQPFQFVSGPFTTADRITGYVSFSSPLEPNLPLLTPVSPTSFSFIDGVQSYSSADNPFFHLFEFATDAQGTITGWFEGVGTGVSDIETSSNFADISVLDATTLGYVATNTVDGTWTVSTTPEPSTFALFGTGLLGVAATLRMRFA